MTAKRSGHLKKSFESGLSVAEDILGTSIPDGVTSSSESITELQRNNAKVEPLREGRPKRDWNSASNPTSGPAPLNLAVKPGISRDEMNLAEFPLTVLSTRATPGIKTLEFSDSVRGKNGEVINRQWIITGADKFGLPTSSDDEVLLGLLKLTVDDGIVNRKVFFTRYELLKALRWTTEGRSYSRLQKALDRLSGVRIKATNAFYDNDLKNHSTKNFGLIDEYEINNGKDADVRPSFFVWSDVLFKSFQVGFIKKLDLDFYLNLQSAVSKRLYRYLDKHFWYKQVVKINVFTLAHEKIGVSRTYKYLSSLRQQLDPAFDELIELGFVSKYEYSGKGEGAEVAIFSGLGEARSSIPGRDGRPVATEFSAKRILACTEEEGRNTGEQEELHSIESLNVFKDQSKSSECTESVRGLKSSREHNEPTLIKELANPSKQNRGEQYRSEQYRAVFQRLWADLIRRGFNDKQVNKLLAGRARETLTRIEKIIDYCDKHLGAESERRNPLGFLYRAIENPNQFVLPDDNGNNGELVTNSAHKNIRDGLNRTESPQIKRSAPSGEGVVPAKETRGQHHFSVTDKEAEYFTFRSREIARIRSDIEDSTLLEIEQEVESALVKLRGMISPLRYQEALNHGIDERLAKKFSIPSFQEWLRSGGQLL